ncbi:putative nuclease HARBI1 isoform X3 [Linepithema humile]
MSRITFEALLNVVAPLLNPEINMNVNPSKKLLFTLWILAKQESFLATSDRFGLPKSSGHQIFKSVIDILSDLMPQYIYILHGQMQMIVKYPIFETRSRGFYGVIGAIDGCHIPCKQPVDNANDYYNRKGFHSIILQGVCNHRGQFIDCFIGMPGRMHDARVFRLSPLFESLNAINCLIPKKFHLIGDTAYPLLINLMTPFKDNGHLTVVQTRYNQKLSSIRSIIERAFGLLKGKFRRLKYLDISDFELGNKIIAAACTLHNFIINGDHINVEFEDYLEELNLHVNEEQNEEQAEVLEAAQKRSCLVDEI